MRHSTLNNSNNSRPIAGTSFTSLNTGILSTVLYPSSLACLCTEISPEHTSIVQKSVRREEEKKVIRDDDDHDAIQQNVCHDSGHVGGPQA